MNALTHAEAIDKTKIRIKKDIPQSGFSIQEIHEKLKNNGSRLTLQREYILDVFFNNNSSGYHLSVEDIHKQLIKRNNSQISLATVYRTVKTLHTLGILREVDLAEGHKHYELASSKEDHHHHIVCMNSNKTIEFFNEEVNQLAKDIAAKHRIEVLDVELKIFGKCLDHVNCHNDVQSHRR